MNRFRYALAIVRIVKQIYWEDLIDADGKIANESKVRHCACHGVACAQLDF